MTVQSSATQVSSAQPPSSAAENAAFIRLLGSPVRFRLYLLTRIPSAFFSGLRIAEANAGSCTVTVPFKWFTKNPFRSTYFACLSMAAEMSTGILAMAGVYKRQPRVSMLVVKMEANFFKKATGTTRFTCADGDAIRETIELAISTGEAQVIRSRAEGAGPNGEIIAEFYITWSFKAKP
jgi:hypothetical protein